MKNVFMSEENIADFAEVADTKKTYELPAEKWEDLLCGDYILTAEPTVNKSSLYYVYGMMQSGQVLNFIIEAPLVEGANELFHSYRVYGFFIAPRGGSRDSVKNIQPQEIGWSLLDGALLGEVRARNFDAAECDLFNVVYEQAEKLSSKGATLMQTSREKNLLHKMEDFYSPELMQEDLVETSPTKAAFIKKWLAKSSQTSLELEIVYNRAVSFISTQKLRKPRKEVALAADSGQLALFC